MMDGISEQQAAALRLAVSCIEDAARDGGELGAPSGIVYAALSTQGMRLESYQSILAAMERMGRIYVDGSQCIHLRAQEAP